VYILLCVYSTNTFFYRGLYPPLTPQPTAHRVASGDSAPPHMRSNRSVRLIEIHIYNILIQNITSTYIYLKSTPFIYQHDGGAHYFIPHRQSPFLSFAIYNYFLFS
jgi:hypothetical protein